MARDRNHIGSYRLLKLIRSGNSCQIWEVIDETNNRRGALKSLKDEFRSNREEITLLKNEHLVGSTLDHENVIRIDHYDSINGIPHLAMEYFRSNNVKQWIRLMRESDDAKKLLPKIIKQTAEGLKHLHQQGWIHRDVKPDNFLVDDTGLVKLIDFAITERGKTGFARFLGGKSKIQGTRSYMSPEQIRGERLDYRSDIYSYGCMLFELFCGRPPFTGGSPDELLQKHLRAAVPSVAAGNDDVTPEFTKLIAKMMAKQKDKRIESMQQFLEAIKTMRIIRVDRN